MQRGSTGNGGLPEELTGRCLGSCSLFNLVKDFKLREYCMAANIGTVSILCI
jgi:hypothetical protein